MILAVAAIAHASDATDFVQEQGQTPVEKGPSDGTARCDFLLRSTKATIEWTDGDTVYKVSGEPQLLAGIYKSMLPLQAWDTCRFVIGNRARVSFGVKSKKKCLTVAEYADAFETAFTKNTSIYSPAGNQGPSTTPPPDCSYVMNTETMVFHNPSCSDVSQISEDNVSYFTGTREWLMNHGYKPCGHCNP